MVQDAHSADIERQRELAVIRYVQAFDRGDLDALATVLAEAEADPELDRRIAGVNVALHAESGLQPLEAQAQVVRRLLLRHLPSAFPDPELAEQPLTVGDVAARLQADQAAGQSMAASDRLANQHLLGSTVPLPAPVTAATIARLAEQLPVAASARYWELFRRAAVVLGIARQRSQVQLAAARHQPGRRGRSGRSGQSTEQEDKQP